MQYNWTPNLLKLKGLVSNEVSFDKTNRKNGDGLSESYNHKFPILNSEESLEYSSVAIDSKNITIPIHRMLVIYQ